MEKNNSFKESVIYCSVRAFGTVIRFIPVHLALGFGRRLGMLAYYFDSKRRVQAYANLKIAFADTKSPAQIQAITMQCFQSYGQNFIELLRLPLLTKERFNEVVCIQGKEHILEALKFNKGVILLAMHFGSWEVASVSCSMFGHPYKVMVKPQKKHSKLDDLLNFYRSCGGQVVLSRGMGTRDFIKSLKNNEIIGIVVDQGGRDGMLVPFFGRQASMSVGAIRLGIKQGIPICFAIIIREGGHRHRMIFHRPLDITVSGDLEKDIEVNLNKVTQLMEDYIRQYPYEYMWFYKIWKYSNQANIAILADRITGHQRQSEALAKAAQVAISERRIRSRIELIKIEFKNRFLEKLFSLLSVVIHHFVNQGKLGFLKWFLTSKSLQDVYAMKADFIISCGSSLAGMNRILSKEHNAKSCVILKPGLLGYRYFDLVALPRHDRPPAYKHSDDIEERLPFVITNGAPNLVTPEYLLEQTQALLNRYSHLKGKVRTKISVFIGGASKNVYISEYQIKILIHQLKEAAQAIRAEILMTTSRRTPKRIEQLLHKNFKKDPCCPLLILANQQNVPEAVGGMLGLSDINVVSGDSISMISEAASSGKDTVVFFPQTRAKILKGKNKHENFIRNLNQKGYVAACDIKEVGRNICDVAKSKLHTKKMDDQQTLIEALRFVI